MFERFTERARRVIILAREEAGRFRHDFVGTEHILLGLIRDGEGIATAVLQRLGLKLETVKNEVERALAGLPKTLTFGEVPFTPQAKRVLELSIEEARQLGHNYIGTEHLLLGLMKEGQSIAAKILESLGARLDEVRQETLALLGDFAGFLRVGDRDDGVGVLQVLVVVQDHQLVAGDRGAARARRRGRGLGAGGARLPAAGQGPGGLERLPRHVRHLPRALPEGRANLTTRGRIA